jgi:hypothetical protein
MHPSGFIILDICCKSYRILNSYVIENSIKSKPKKFRAIWVWYWYCWKALNEENFMELIS